MKPALIALLAYLAVDALLGTIVWKYITAPILHQLTMALAR